MALSTPSDTDNHNYDGGALFLWQDGAPSPKKGKTRKAMTKVQLEKTLYAAGSLPYVGFWNEDTQSWVIEPEYDGLTNFEVMSIKLAQRASNGDLKAIDMMFDRTMGKPKQALETTTTQLTYSQYLELMANEETNASSEITVTHEPVSPSPPIDIPLSSLYEDDEDDGIDEMARSF